MDTGQRDLDPGMGGLMDYKARFYSPYLNHFIQPDSLIPDPSNPQAWNRYGYVHNNPINFNDPTGHCASGAVVDTIVCVVAWVGVFLVINSLSDTPQNFTPQETEGIENSFYLGVGLLTTAASAQSQVVAQLANLYDCATGTFCDPMSFAMPGTGAPYAEVLENEATNSTAKTLYALGNSSGPRLPRISGFNLKPGQYPDIFIDADGLVIPGRGGASTFESIEQLSEQGLSGNVWELPTGTTLLGFDDVADGVPLGTQPKGHHSLVPSQSVLPEALMKQFTGLPWRQVMNSNGKPLKLAY